MTSTLRNERGVFRFFWARHARISSHRAPVPRGPLLKQQRDDPVNFVDNGLNKCGIVRLEHPIHGRVGFVFEHAHVADTVADLLYCGRPPGSRGQ